MEKRLSIAVLFLILLNPTYGQSTDKSAINASELDKKLDSIFSNLSENEPGCAVTIIQKDKILSRKSYGFANIENHVPFTHQSVVKMPYSEAREFISIAVLLMENDGILSLNDKVKYYFPNLPDWAKSVTIWDLLNHRSGFVDEWATLLLMHNSMSNRFETEQFLRLLYDQPIPEVEPGKGYMYCNSDFGLLRLIMEKASGESLPDWIKRRLFEPLKMNSTSMQKSPLDIIPNRADLYEWVNGSFRHAHVQKTSPGGNYYVLTSASDLELWTAAVSDATSEVSKAIETLSSNVRQIPGKENHFVIGYSYRNIENQQVILHEGVNGFNYLTRIPSKDISVITFGNLHGDGFAEQNKTIIDYILKQRTETPPVFNFKTKPISLPESELAKYTGNFRWQNQVSWEGYHPIRKFSSINLEDGKLKMRYTGNYIVALTPVAKDFFYYQEGEGKDGYGVQFEFRQSSQDAPLNLIVTFDDGFPGVTMIKDTEDWKPSKEKLSEFTGRFFSKHLDYVWNIELNEVGKLILKSSNLPDTELEPDGKNQFHFIGEQYPGNGFDRWILYNKNDEGVITHLTVWSGRVMHHRFDKQ